MNSAKICNELLGTFMLLTIIYVVSTFSSADGFIIPRNITCNYNDTVFKCNGVQKAISQVEDILEMISTHSEVMLNIDGLQFDPNFTFENTNITKLTLCCGLETFPSNLFLGLGLTLHNLNMQNNNISNIDEHLFSPLHNLIELFLDFNKLCNLKPSMFNSLHNLTYLSITRNDFRRVNSDVFQNLHSLHTLVLSHNNITLFENVNIISSSLSILILSHCLIQDVLKEDTFTDLPSLENLDISYNKITAIDPNSLSSLKDLKILNVSNNIVEELKGNSFAMLTNLKDLDLRNNLISAIDETAFFSLSNLTYLDLSENKLKVFLSEYVTDLSNIRQLYLHNNGMEKFTAEVLIHSLTLKKLTTTGQYNLIFSLKNDDT